MYQLQLTFDMYLSFHFAKINNTPIPAPDC